MLDVWNICYLAQYPNGETVDPDKPIQSANIVAKTEAEAVAKLKDEFRMCKLKICGKPSRFQVSEEEYNKE